MVPVESAQLFQLYFTVSVPNKIVSRHFTESLGLTPNKQGEGDTCRVDEGGFGWMVVMFVSIFLFVFEVLFFVFFFTFSCPSLINFPLLRKQSFHSHK